MLMNIFKIFIGLIATIIREVKIYEQIDMVIGRKISLRELEFCYKEPTLIVITSEEFVAERLALFSSDESNYWLPDI